ncbi:MAG: hypothetical protein JWN09_123 [Microbacteriaceae bacterium]|jgi:hypothetical protein|nr:hypothetical protein [Microbacteriaceae bacterium]
MAKAASFAAYIALVAAAEKRLIAAGQRDPVQRLVTLRGVYYGTTWSLDYDKESKRSVPGATIRNFGFFTYLGGTMPADPRPALAGSTLLADLKLSQSMHDGLRSADVGHLLIGLESRTTTAGTTHFPQEGGTGLEIVTWLGDLGGGAANLARRRATAPATTVEYVFHNASSDYGVTDNLEGDVAAYVTASRVAGDKPTFSTVADALRGYLLPATGALWKGRAAGFAAATGATLGPKGAIANETAWISALTTKLYDFGIWYAATRWVHTGELTGSAASATCTHMHGAAEEVATVFVKTLGRAILRAPAAIDAVAPYPAPTPPGSCQSLLLQAAGLLKLPSLRLPSLDF